MRLFLTLLTVLVLAGCSPPQLHSKHEPLKPPTNTLEGQHESSTPHTTMGKFASYTSYGMLANCTSTTLSAWFPTFGRRTVTMVAGDWNYGDKGEWRGSFTEPDGRIWHVYVTVDVLAAVSIALTDGRGDGLSDTIVWKCIPTGRG